MKNGVLCAVIETQMNTELLFCIKVKKIKRSNLKQKISRISIFADNDLPRNTAKIGRRENFLFNSIRKQQTRVELMHFDEI